MRLLDYSRLSGALDGDGVISERHGMGAPGYGTTPFVCVCVCVGYIRMLTTVELELLNHSY